MRKYLLAVLTTAAVLAVLLPAAAGVIGLVAAVLTAPALDV